MASIDKTIDYFKKHPSVKYKTLGKTGFKVSVCGFGGYRISDGNKKHYSAIESAILSGINIIDTSSNYADGKSELLIGNVLNDLIHKNKIERDEIVLVTKGGYLQGSNLKLATEREENGKPFSEVVKCSPDLWHCISPDFLEDQITRSLQRLNVQKIDVFLLHNPEYFLTYSIISDDVRREREYYRRIKNAFLHLEQEVSKGRILFYGISSNTFGERSNKSNFTSLEKVLSAANEISSENHFAVIQLPLNIMEKGAVINLNNSDEKKSVLQLAAENNLGVLINRLLNAINKNRLIRLADYPIKENRTFEEIKELIEDLSQQENFLLKKYVSELALPAEEVSTIKECFSLSQILIKNYNRFENPNQFHEIKEMYLIPRANYAIAGIGEQNGDDEYCKRSLRNYAVTANIIFDSIHSELSRLKNDENKVLHSKINAYLNTEQAKATLSQKAILLINSVAEVSSTLVGMRNIDYVNDCLKSIGLDFAENPVKIWHNVSLD